MKNYILTGAPGSGKTTLIKKLKELNYSVVREAATDIITLEQSLGNLEPWSDSSFIEKILELQIKRQKEAQTSNLQFFDRSPLCTYALNIFLKFPISLKLEQEINRIRTNKIYEKRVFFIRNLGFCTPTTARKISFVESLLFEKIHHEVYTKFGYECFEINPKSTLNRIDDILNNCLQIT